MSKRTRPQKKMRKSFEDGRKLLVIGGVILIGLAMLMMVMRMKNRESQSGAAGGLTAVSADGKVIDGSTSNGNSSSQAAGDLNVTLTLLPYPPDISKVSTFNVKLQDSAGAEVNDAVITINLNMPSMWMPPNQVSLSSFGQGSYIADGRFTMRGEWQIEVVIERAGKTQAVYFKVG
ncbi:MAG: FixH family protein, partial [Chloroflexota bacterium]